MSWLTTGTAHRSPVQRTPVIHLLVTSGGNKWEMWCSGSKGRPDNPHGNRLCAECRALARECDERGELDPGYERWLTPPRGDKA